MWNMILPLAAGLIQGLSNSRTQKRQETTQANQFGAQQAEERRQFDLRNALDARQVALAEDAARRRNESLGRTAEPRQQMMAQILSRLGVR